MNAKEMLNELRTLNAIIESRSEELQVIFSKATSITAPISNDISGNMVSDKIGNLVAIYIDKETELELREIVSRANFIKRQIDKLKSPTEIRVLYLIYDKGLMIKEIEGIMYTCASNINRIRRQAERNLQEVLDESERVDRLLNEKS